MNSKSMNAHVGTIPIALKIQSNSNQTGIEPSTKLNKKNDTN